MMYVIILQKESANEHIVELPHKHIQQICYGRMAS